METYCGTTGYASPEMLAGRKYLGIETDVWSLGIILYTLLAGGLPFDDDNEGVMKELILKGEYEEPEWITEGELQIRIPLTLDARSLIHGMLRVDPSQRLSIEDILTHQWFKSTIVDKMPDQNEGPPISPGLTPHFDEPFNRPTSQHLQIPSRGASPLHMDRPPPISEESDQSETSHEQADSEHGKADTVSTAATTASGGDNDDIQRVHSGEFSQTEKDLEMLHSNESQSTIRRTGSESPNPSTGFKSRIAIKSGLEGHKESDEDAINEDHSTPLLVAQHSRTPSRTKRRSVSSTLSLERRHSHHSTSGQWTSWPPEDYMLKLNATQPEPFSTPSEKHLLDQLEAVGFNVGQITHSVNSNACDSSAAAWWMLRAKQAERGETDEVVTARQAASQRKSERAAAYARDERKRSQKDKDRSPSTSLKAVNVKFQDQPTFSKTPDMPTVELGSPIESTAPLSVSPQAMTPMDIGNVPQPDMLHAHSVPPVMPQLEQVRSSEPVPADPTTAESSPSKENQRPTKTRSPSMSMLQRATSALVSGSWKNEEKGNEKAVVDEGDGKEDKRSISPTKLTKPAPRAKMVKSESDRSLAQSIDSSHTMEAGPSRRMSTPLLTSDAHEDKGRPSSTDSPASGSKSQKRDFWSWNSFKYMFNDPRRRRSRDDSTPTKDHKGPAVVLSRGISGRGPHVNRMVQPHPIRRSSSDGRPVYSRRSSSVNSRRSSFNSGMVHDSSHDALPALALGRHASARSHGSQTPTSEREFNPLSRPSSIHERDSHLHPSRRSSQNLRSPSMQSEGSRTFRYPTPASPLHNYQRRAPKGTDSRRVRHIRVIPEGHIIKSDSVASSIRSNASSRASSRERATGREDSDYDTGREDASIRSRRRSDMGSLAQQIHRKNSPLTLPGHYHHRSHSLKPPEPKPKVPLRDVFQGKEEDWVSDDEDIYSGGLGQKGQQSHVETMAHSTWEPNTRAAFSPRDRENGRGRGRKHASGHGQKGSSRSRRNSSDEEEGKKSNQGHGGRQSGGDEKSSGVMETGVAGAGRRRGIPSGRGTAPVIQEEEEEEE